MILQFWLGRLSLGPVEGIGTRSKVAEGCFDPPILGDRDSRESNLKSRLCSRTTGPSGALGDRDRAGLQSARPALRTPPFTQSLRQARADSRPQKRVSSPRRALKRSRDAKQEHFHPSFYQTEAVVSDRNPRLRKPVNQPDGPVPRGSCPHYRWLGP